MLSARATISSPAAGTTRTCLHDAPIVLSMSIRIEQYDGGEVLYVALDPDGVWAKSEFPDELVTIDYNAQGGIIGVELLGSLARASAGAVFDTFLEAVEIGNRQALKKALAPVVHA